MRRRTGPKAKPRLGKSVGGGPTKIPPSELIEESASLLPAEEVEEVDIESYRTTTTAVSDDINVSNNNNNNDESLLLSEVPRKELFPDSEYDVDPIARKKDKIFYGAFVGLFVVSLIYLIFFSGRIQTFQWMHISQVKELMETANSVVLLNDSSKGEYVVFLSKSDGNKQSALVSMGKSSTSAKEALRDAQAKWIRRFGPAGMKSRWIKMDVVTQIHSFPNFNWMEEKSSLKKLQTRWLGMALGRDQWYDGGAIWLPDQVYALGLLDSNGERLRWDHIAKELATRSSQSSSSSSHPSGGSANSHIWPLSADTRNDDSTELSHVDFFETKSVFLDLSTQSSSSPLAFHLYHGHRMISTLTPEYLYEASLAAGKYLTRQVKTGGRMVYMYQPRSDVEPDAYGYIRHAGTTYSMALLYKYWKDEKLLDATKSALDHLVQERLSKDCPKAYDDDKASSGGRAATDSSTTYCFINSRHHGDPWSSLGMDALGLLAMAQYQESTGDSGRYLHVAKRIAAHIVSFQRTADGSMVQEQNIRTGELDEDAYTLYFPGEAAYALSKLVNVNERNVPEVSEEELVQWKQTASRAMDYIVQRESKKPDGKFTNDHWMMYAMAEMRFWHLTDGMVEFGMRTARIAHERQTTPNAIQPMVDKADEFGLYKSDLSVCATATKSEGLCAILPIAIEKGKEQEEEWMWNSIEYGIRYTLQAQHTPEVAMYMKNPGRIVGALSKNIRKRETRNDYTQHNLSSYLCLMNLLEKKTSGKSRLGKADSVFGGSVDATGAVSAKKK